MLPDLQELVALRGAAHGLSLRAHRAALAQLQGGHRSVQLGRGLEFEEVRPYVPGDDARAIDWRVTARRGRPHTKLYREDRERPVWLLADLHPSLYFGSKRQLKSALLVRAAALLGWATVLGGDRLGAVISSGAGASDIFPPRSREAGVLPVLQALVQAQPTQPAAYANVAGLSASLASLRPLIKPGSMILLLSDFSGLDDDAQRMLTRVVVHCDCRLLWIIDPLETAGLPRGDYRAGLPGRLWSLDGDRSRAAWLAAWSARANRVESIAQRLNLPLTRLHTNDDLSLVLPPLLRTPRWAA